MDRFVSTHTFFGKEDLKLLDKSPRDWGFPPEWAEWNDVASEPIWTPDFYPTLLTTTTFDGCQSLNWK